ncbi:MAG TPA: hypothetical protein VNE82_05650, partial [Candidatus Binataceae bacterium]|nr:hypothetical protein [Candidatus Binataceae bacterium]
DEPPRKHQTARGESMLVDLADARFDIRPQFMGRPDDCHVATHVRMASRGLVSEIIEMKRRQALAPSGYSGAYEIFLSSCVVNSTVI